MKTHKNPWRTWPVLLCLVAASGMAHSQSNWRYEVRLDFPIVGLPGHNLHNLFQQAGLTLGVYHTLNRAETLVSGISFSGYRMRNHGATLGASAQVGYRPRFGRLEAGLDLGLGYQYVRAPREQYNWDGDDWQRVHGGKGMLFVPLGMRLGYRSIHLGQAELRPFVAFQQQVALGYNPSLPLLPVSVFSIGQTLQF